MAANGRDALMFAFRDGSCGLVFSTAAANNAGFGAYVSGMSGDYVLNLSPLGGEATSSALAAVPRLEGRASNHPNVRVLLRSGRVTPRPHAHLRTENLPSIDTTSACAQIMPPPSAADSSPVPYDVVSNATPCPLVRVLTWAWSAQQGTTQPAATSEQITRLIAGWTCTGPTATGPDAVGKTVTCTNQQQTISLTGRKITTTSLPVTTP